MSSLWSGWHAGCHRGLPWDPSKLSSDDEEKTKQKKESKITENEGGVSGRLASKTVLTFKHPITLMMYPSVRQNC